MPEPKTSPSNALAWTAGILVAVVLAGVAGWLVFRKASPPPNPKTVAPAGNSAVAPEATAEADDSIVLKEDFGTLESGKWPKGWRGWESGKSRRMKILEEAGHHVLEFTATEAFRMRLSRIVPCSQKYNTYDFSVQARVQDMTPRQGQIRGITLGVDWLDANSKDISESDLDYLTEKGDWQLLQGVYQAPPNAVAMRIFPLLTRCGGTVDFKNIIVKGVEPQPEKVVYEENFEHAATPAEVKSWQWYSIGPDESLSIKTESGDHFLEYHAATNTEMKRIGSVEIPLDPSWSRIRFSAQGRGRGLKPDSTHNVAGLCILAYWKDESHNKVSPYRVQSDAVRNNDIWKHLDETRTIPPDAKSIELNLFFISASGGVDISDIKVTVVQ